MPSIALGDVLDKCLARPLLMDARKHLQIAIRTYTDEDLPGSLQRSWQNAGLVVLCESLIFVAMLLWLLTQSALMAGLTRGRDGQDLHTLATAIGAAILTMVARSASAAQGVARRVRTEATRGGAP